jgi:hypothetical protein
MNEKQFYKDDYKTRDYGSLMHEYEKHLQHGEKIPNKKWKKEKDKLRKWTSDDQVLEDELWAS